MTNTQTGQHTLKCLGMSWPGGMLKRLLFGRFEDLEDGDLG